MKGQGFFLACVVFGAFTYSAAAHHSFAMFNRQHVIELQGTVQEFQWTNPHSFLEIVVEDGRGQAAQWTIEMNGPRALITQGWKPKSVVTGDKVHLQVYPARNGANFAQFKLITLPDGRTLGDTSSPGLEREPTNQ